jgi:hypothetical protein
LSTALESPNVQSVMADRTTSKWLKLALESALQRDPADALNDTLLLAGLLEERLRLLFDLAGLERIASEKD